MSTKGKGHIFAIFCVLVWGTTFVASRLLLDYLTATELLMFRFALGFVALYLMNPKIFKWQGLEKEKYFMCAGLAGVTFYYFLENVALLHTSTSNVSIIVSLAPIFTAIMMKLVYQEKCGRFFYLGCAISLVGIVLICMTEEGLAFHPLGDGLAILAAFVWGIYSVTMKKVVEFQYNAIHYTRRIFCYGIIGMIPFTYFLDFEWGAIRLVQTPLLIGCLLLLGIIACAICFVVWNLAIQYLGAITSSTYIYLIPIVTIVFSAIFLQEHLTAFSAAGVVLTIVGLFVTSK